MKFYIGNQALNHAKEILSLLRDYSAAGYSPLEILHSTTLGFDMADLRRYAHTDQMPVRIRGELHPVNEKAASIIASIAPIMEGMVSDGVTDAASACAEALGCILSGLGDRRTVTITLTNPWSGELTLSMPGKAAQTHFTDPTFISCVALGMSDVEMDELQTAIRLDHGELIPA